MLNPILRTCFCLFFIIFSVTTEEFTCPDIEDPPCSASKYPVPDDCTSYYQCDAGCNDYKFACPSGLHFNDFTKNCDLPENAQCIETTTAVGGSTQSTTTQSTTTQSTTTQSTTTQSTTTTEISTTTEDPTTTEKTTTTDMPTTTTQSTTTSSTTQPPTTAAPGARGIVSVARNQSQTQPGPANMDYDLILADISNEWDRTSRTFTPSNTAFYLVSLTTAGSGIIDNYLYAQNRSEHRLGARMLSGNQNSALGTFGTTGILDMTQGERYVSTYTSTTKPLSEAGNLLSLSAFDLTNSMKVGSCIFSLIRNANWPPNPPSVEFDETESQQGNCVTNNKFKAAVSGIYFFSLTLQSADYQNLWIAFTTSTSKLVELWRGTKIFERQGTVNRAFMTQLSAGDELELEVVQGNIGNAYSGYSRLSGFLYDPVMHDPVAWTLHTISDQAAITTPKKVIWEEVALNEGGAYDHNTNSVKISQSSHYFVHLDASSFPGARIGIGLHKNSEEIMSLRRKWTDGTAPDNMARGMVIWCNAGDVLEVYIESNTRVYSDTDKQTSFTGLLIP